MGEQTKLYYRSKDERRCQNIKMLYEMNGHNLIYELTNVTK